MKNIIKTTQTTFTNTALSHILFHFAVFAVVILSASCGRSSAGRSLAVADSLTEADQRAAITYIDSIVSQTQGNLPRSDRMKLALLRAKAMNKLLMPLNRDSLLLLSEYFADHGTPNDRMLATYILGCSYLDGKDAPRALEYFHEAAAMADTTAEDCDWRTLHKVHVQSAELLYRQYAVKNAFDENALAKHCAAKARDTLNTLVTLEQLANIYMVEDVRDSAIAIRTRLYNLYKKYDCGRHAAICAGVLINLLVSENRINEAKHYIDIYENNSGLFDADGRIVKGYEAYYVIKGNYCLATDRLDSAELYYRKGINVYKSFGMLEQSFKGLAMLYKKLDRLDSVAKYADLSRQMTDSAFNNSVTTNLQQMQAIYDYSRFQVEAEKAKNDSVVAYWMNAFVILISVVFIFVLLLFMRAFINRKKKFVKTEISKYEQNINELKKTQREYSILIENRQAKMDSLLEEKVREIERLQRENAEIEKKYNLSKCLKFSDESIIKQIANHARKDFKCMTVAEYTKLKEIFSTYPPFSKWENELNDNEYQICLLIRIGFTPSEIGILTKLSPSNISNIRKRLYQKLAGKEGTPKDFDRYIKAL